MLRCSGKRCQAVSWLEAPTPAPPTRAPPFLGLSVKPAMPGEAGVEAGPGRSITETPNWEMGVVWTGCPLVMFLDHETN